MNTNIAPKRRTIQAADAELFPYRMMDEYLSNRTAGKGVYDPCDGKAQFILACDEEQCLGGIRIHLSNESHPSLPLEQNVNVRDLFDGLVDEVTLCAELSRLYIHQKCESSLHVLFMLLKTSFNLLMDKQVSHVFVLIREHELSMYQQAAAVLGCRFHHRAVPQDFVPETLQNFINHKTIQVFCLEMR